MRNIDELERLGRVHDIILKKRNGTPAELASYLGISRSCLYKYIDELKVLGADVAYSRNFGFFYYRNEFRLKILIETSEICQIIGGVDLLRLRIMDGDFFSLGSHDNCCNRL